MRAEEVMMTSSAYCRLVGVINMDSLLNKIKVPKNLIQNLILTENTT